MKISYNWLREHVALELSAQQLAQRLLELGFEVASIEKRGPSFQGVVTARILEIAKHPNADRLSLCTVDDGAQKLSIVCGAKNVAVGQAVALARIGAELPGGRKLTPAKIRGVDSEGMLCSASELGLGGDHAGILVLEPETAVGQDFAQRLGPGDDILEVEVTPNRPDCLSHRGLARELAASLKIPLKSLAIPAPAAAGECPPVFIEAPQACSLYIGRALTGVKVAPSPGWLAAKLEAVGLRPINNVVDVTNFILMDMGQPLHAFDASCLAGPEIHVRFARPGETLKALDEKFYSLPAQCLVIADKEKPVAIAGIMGGLDSAVTAKTTSVFLESAHFAGPVVRKASQALKLKSDASYRFERGADPGAAVAAAQRAAALILQLCGPQASSSAARQSGAPPRQAAAITVTSARINEILGSTFSDDAVAGALGGLGEFARHGSALTLTPPTWRADLATAWDLAEETARMLGYDHVPSEAAPVALRPARLTPSQALAERCRRRLAAVGLMEAYNYDFVSPKLLERARLDVSLQPRLANPLSEDWTLLRSSLLPGLLLNAAANVNRGAASVRLFELGCEFTLQGKAVAERRHAAGLMLGPVTERFWKPARTPDADLYDAKGAVADLLSGIPGIVWTPLSASSTKTASDALFHPAAALRLETSQGALGTVGLLHPSVARAFALERETVALFDLDLDLLVRLPPEKVHFSPYSPYPVSRRDLSLLAALSLPYAEVDAAVRRGAGPQLQGLELVDVFAGKGVPEGLHSLTLRLTLGSPDRTLTDAEINAAVERALAELKRLGAELRA